MVEVNEDLLKELIELILDDEWGIPYEAYASLHRLLPEDFVIKHKEMFNQVDVCENRAFLLERWKEYVRD